MIYFGNEYHGNEIMVSTGGSFSFDTMTVISRAVDDDFKGGVVFENWTGKGGSVLAHLAGFSPNWLNRDLLWVMFHYPFMQLDCTHAFVQVKGKNKASKNIVEAMGFKEVITLKDVYPDDDMILYRLYRDECRFLKVKPRNLNFKRMN